MYDSNFFALSLGISKVIVSPYNLKFNTDKETSQLLSFIQSGNVTKNLRFRESLNLVILEFTFIDLLKFMRKNQRYMYQWNKMIKFLRNLV